MVGPSLKIYDDKIDPKRTFYTGHTPLQIFLLAFIWKIFGYSLQVSHLFIIAIGLMGILFTYKLAKYLFNPIVGFGAVFLLAFNQLFFAQMGTMHFSIPLTSFGVMTVYFYLKKRSVLFTIFGFIMVLTKETSAIMILAIFAHFYISIWIKKKKIDINDVKNSLFIILPLIYLFIWMIYLKITLGWIYSPVFNYIFQNSGIMQNIADHFIYDHIGDTFYNSIISFFILLSLFTLKKTYILSKYSLPFLIIIFHTILFSYTVNLQRYFLPVLPFFYILGSNSIFVMLPKSKWKNFLFYLIITILVVLFISNYNGNRNEDCGCSLETNLEYLDLIQTHKAAAEYIEKNFPNSIVITCWPMTQELQDSRYGYVSKRIKTTTNISTHGKEVIVYHSPLSACRGLLNALNESDLTLLRRFEQNNKFTEIYRRNVKS